MARVLTVGAAQLGPIQKAESRTSVVNRMLALVEAANDKGCDLIVFTELSLTTFFPRWYMEDQAEVDQWFEAEMPGPDTQALFDTTRQYQMAFHLGYAELIEEEGELHRYNTAILVDRDGQIAGKYRKVHLPGHDEFDTERDFQHLEKRYFEVGNLGFPVWRFLDGIFGMCICNDRRWPETYRVMGLQGVEMVVLGYNTPSTNSQSDEAPHVRAFHNLISMQAGAYQNSTWVVGVAKAGCEDGHDLMGGSAIIAPTGEVVAQCRTLDDELIVADCDLDATKFGKETIFDFARHRRIEHYGLITERTGVELPPE
ncbi:MAG: N-carbamoyl-D-amino-acid hydrolase [Proteobacteria bacterium]|jgi:predicted amidohydrolase|nr:N-carbamoyl-D-amino-acid hydrolase [Pseudomonadota bacterium]MBP08918.1 N-carbamoyl-D-amino-acid hydrolase [Acidiferrobacteraceae bacterium]MDP6137338.1 N-carbamoyl-D-amino-acid hydrolase [Arenicellales bacterium]HJP09167.1 N-carbamoyl-D-amino-acid hydrolase [Arenicellales bacterium]|tara:strand:- start:134 stop:1072 length:939 start_codon:yes stop_codon:yes gene_type:complete